MNNPENRDAMAENIDRAVEKSALRKVRNLVDELQEEDEKQRGMQKWIIAAGAVVAIGVFAWVTMQKQRDTAAEARGACELAQWQQRIGVLTAEIKGRNPGIAHVELQRQLDTHRAQIELAASKACAPR